MDFLIPVITIVVIGVLCIIAYAIFNLINNKNSETDTEDENITLTQPIIGPDKKEYIVFSGEMLGYCWEQSNFLNAPYFSSEEQSALLTMLKTDKSRDGSYIIRDDLFYMPLELLLYSEQSKNFDLAFEYLKMLYFIEPRNIIKEYYAQLVLIEEFYKRREDPSYLEKCIQLCYDNLNILPLFLNEISKIDNQIPTLPAIKRLAIIFEKQNRINDAIELSKIGSCFNKTTGEFQKRLERLEKKINDNDLSEGLDIFYNYEDIKGCEDLSKIVLHLGNALEQKAYKFNKTNDFCDNYTVLDVETTGLNYKNEAIIEIGAIKIRNNKEIARFETFINPGFPIPKEATAINHITDDMVKNAPFIAEKLPELIEFIGDDIIIGHNVSFDVRFVLAACDENFIPNPNFTVFNTLPLARKYINDVDNYSLPTLKEHLRINTESHRAIDDCLTTNALYQYCYSKSRDNRIIEVPSDNEYEDEALNGKLS